MNYALVCDLVGATEVLDWETGGQNFAPSGFHQRAFPLISQCLIISPDN